VCVCLSVCPDHIFGTTIPIFTNFLCKFPMASVFLWQRSDTLGISGVMDDVTFAHKLRLLDVAAKLRQGGSHLHSLRLGA